MELQDMDWTNVTIRNVPKAQAEALKQWRTNVIEDDDKVGLWLYGPRAVGTSFAAKVIIGRLAFDDGYADRVHHVLAVDLVRSLRKTWDGGAQVRAHAEDDGLWREVQEREMSIEFLFYEAPVLWIDDLHHDTIDWNIWRKQFQPLVERRVKHRQPTVVSTTLPPSNTWLPKGLIDLHFVTVGMLEEVPRALPIGLNLGDDDFD
jgi:hypothetical protein